MSARGHQGFPRSPGTTVIHGARRSWLVEPTRAKSGAAAGWTQSPKSETSSSPARMSSLCARTGDGSDGSDVSDEESDYTVTPMVTLPAPLTLTPGTTDAWDALLGRRPQPGLGQLCTSEPFGKDSPLQLRMGSSGHLEGSERDSVENSLAQRAAELAILESQMGEAELPTDPPTPKALTSPSFTASSCSE